MALVFSSSRFMKANQYLQKQHLFRNHHHQSPSSSSNLPKKAPQTQKKDKIRIREEPLWTMYCKGKKNGYNVWREATEKDLYVIELLKAMLMGVGVLPSRFEVEEGGGGGEGGELAYV
ncbi:hypothetical protein VNO80_10178 [Phaseolus coccineus]|uniref:Uncharacterized protein n=1 Tax=Phaseolus coccineus TaxID=3886 RepID=A0AAN9N7Y1_PHACN